MSGGHYLNCRVEYSVGSSSSDYDVSGSRTPYNNDINAEEMVPFTIITMLLSANIETS